MKPLAEIRQNASERSKSIAEPPGVGSPNLYGHSQSRLFNLT